MLPLSKGKIPTSIDIKVVFPAPLCPNKAKHSFLLMLSETLFTAYIIVFLLHNLNVLYFLLTLDTIILF
jgi:hypothetical protein